MKKAGRKVNDLSIDVKLVDIAMNAVLPWKSIDATPPINFNRLVDSQAQIEKCLSCPKLSCTNCLHGRKSKYVSKKLIALQPKAESERKECHEFIN